MTIARLKDSTVLITGGTGSFGNRVAAHLTQWKPKEIRIFSRDEKKQYEMSRHFPDFTYMIGDIRDPTRVLEAMQGVDFVFHAAALKQVPSCELYPYEAVKTNVLGSANVCSAATAAGVTAVVVLSTDKAVKPVNAMGISKAMMEKIVCSQNNKTTTTVFCCVRYGNVMGSRGSVIPLFQQQIKQGDPLTITVPQMTRFLMTLDQSVDLVLHAMTNALGGEIFVRKSPAATVLSLARAIAAESSPNGIDHPMQTIGIRAGEKLHEILVNEYEMQRVAEYPEYYVIHPEYRIPQSRTTQQLGVEYTSENTVRLESTEEIGRLLRRMGQVDYYT